LFLCLEIEKRYNTVIIEKEEDDDVEFQIINIRMSIPRIPKGVDTAAAIKRKLRFRKFRTT
jgi:hypothetical protein